MRPNQQFIQLLNNPGKFKGDIICDRPLFVGTLPNGDNYLSISTGTRVGLSLVGIGELKVKLLVVGFGLPGETGSLSGSGGGGEGGVVDYRSNFTLEGGTDYHFQVGGNVDPTQSLVRVFRKIGPLELPISIPPEDLLINYDGGGGGSSGGSSTSPGSPTGKNGSPGTILNLLGEDIEFGYGGGGGASTNQQVNVFQWFGGISNSPSPSFGYGGSVTKESGKSAKILPGYQGGSYGGGGGGGASYYRESGGSYTWVNSAGGSGGRGHIIVVWTPAS
jgi:hypothetical protein